MRTNLFRSAIVFFCLACCSAGPAVPLSHEEEVELHFLSAGAEQCSALAKDDQTKQAPEMSFSGDCDGAPRGC